MDVGADNFRFDLDTKNGLKAAVQTCRAPATTELHIDSLDRYLPRMLQTNSIFLNFPNQNVAKLAGPILLNTSLSGTNLTIQTSRPLTYGYYGRVALTQFQLRYQQPTFKLGYNSGSLLVTGTSPTQVTAAHAIIIPDGYYTYTTAAAALQTAMRAFTELAAATCTPPTAPGGGFTFSSGSGSVYMSFVWGQTGTAEAGQIISGRFGRNLGFNRAIYGYTPEINTSGQPPGPNGSILWLTATGGPPNFLPTDYIDIVSTSLTNYKDAKDTNTSLSAPTAVMGRVWLIEGSTDVGSTPSDETAIGSAPISLVKNWYNPNWCEWSPNQTINSIDIKLLDMWGEVIPWNSTYSTEWSATLTLTE
jgi:hypothetical protein